MTTYSQPFFPVLLLLTVLGLLFSPRPAAKPLFKMAGVALLLFCWPPFACLLLLPFEYPYSRQPPADRDVQAIVVLSSAVFPSAPPRPTAILGTDTFERCQYAAWLYRNWRTVPVLASGGGSREGPAYSLTMAEALVKEGVPADSVWTEEKSRSTYENAAFSVEILRKKGIRKIALVTEAYHMARAERCFKKLGIEVVPAACGFRTGWHLPPQEYIPSWEAVSWNEDTLHETIGLLWYRFKGRI